ncbi:MAG: hypothetical protein NW217_05830 [Hyphomicrobiaceae bacterium]|nr:hypothetical protein [Hyphomicrobiaceae bacterium]
MNHWIGIVIGLVPVLLVARLVLKPPVYWFFVVLCAVGLGYLHMTGAAIELGNAILTFVNGVFPTGIEPTKAGAPA